MQRGREGQCECVAGKGKVDGRECVAMCNGTVWICMRVHVCSTTG